MAKVALVGLGKMGISHLAILRAHPAIDLVGACDGIGYLTKNLERYSGIPCFSDLDEMLEAAQPDALLIATPTASHAPIAANAMNRGISVFCEKPFVLDPGQGRELIDLATAKSLVTQVGYHYRFVATFEKAYRIAQSGALGKIHHTRVEAYGPVVVKPQGLTWRSKKEEGGGVVYDYACHAIDLAQFIVGEIASVDGVQRGSVFSRDVDDEVYASLHFVNGSSGQLCANWSDPSYRKMSTKISVWGTHGSLTADRQECLVYLDAARDNDENLSKGWNAFNITELTDYEGYYLRGEEYSRQIDYFVESLAASRTDGINSFSSAYSTDLVVAMILGKVSRPDISPRKMPPWRRLKRKLGAIGR